MAALSPTYASPGLRWGLALEDHPGAWVDFKEVPGSELGVPARLGGDGLFCVATINFPEGSGRRPVIGYKPVESKIRGGDASLDHLSDKWNILCTKALGRALKRAGYPDDMTDLKALVVWRQRDAEIRAIGSGTTQVSLPAAQPERALDAAGKVDREAVGSDDANAPDTEVSDAELVEPEPESADPSLVPPSDATLGELRKVINAMGAKSGELTRWAREQKIRVTKPATEADVQRLIAQAGIIVAEPAPDDGAPDELPLLAVDDPGGEMADQVIELAAGLASEDEAKNYNAFLKSLGVDTKSSPRDWGADVLTEVLGWLAIGDEG